MSASLSAQMTFSSFLRIQKGIDVLTNTHSFKLKVTLPISHHLGCNFYRRDDGTMHFSPKNHIDKMVDCCYNMFGTKTNLNFSLPLERGGHPELDTSEHLHLDEVSQHQSMISANQWAISLGRLDVKTAVMNLAYLELSLDKAIFIVEREFFVFSQV